MRKRVLLGAAVGMIMWSALPSAAADTNAYSMGSGILRGFANILVGWIEIPRCLTYNAVDYPVIGIVPGAFEGAGMTLIRAGGGLIDLLTLGFLAPGHTVYDSMEAPMLPWESPWLPSKEPETTGGR